MKLSKNFWLSEFLTSQTATRKGIENTPDESQGNSLKLLCENILQPLRDWYKHPIRINSGFRSTELNKAIGGSKTSQHCKGQAADIDTVLHNAELFNYIRLHLDFDQLIWEFGDDNAPAWVHVSYKGTKNRNEVLKAVKENGKTKYVKL